MKAKTNVTVQDQDGNSSKPLLYEGVSLGLKVIDSEQVEGIIDEIFDIHNVKVKYKKGGSGLYCLEKNCSEYDGLHTFI